MYFEKAIINQGERDGERVGMVTFSTTDINTVHTIVNLYNKNPRTMFLIYPKQGQPLAEQTIVNRPMLSAKSVFCDGDRWLKENPWITAKIPEPKQLDVKIEKVIFNNPATIVIWSDGVKTVVKRQKGDRWDKEKGLAMAIAKRAMGNKGAYCNELNKWL